MWKSTGRRLFEMLRNGYMADVTFVVQGTEIKGHRVVASSQGGVLKNLLKEGTTTVMIDKEISPKTFRTVLEFLYMDDCKVNFDNISMLIDAAIILQLRSLEDHCAKAKQTVAKAFLKQTNDVEEYSKVCQQYFRKNSSEIMKSKEYLEFSREVFVVFCSACFANLELFFACIEWAKTECKRLSLAGTPKNLRSVVRDALAEINFTRMDSKDFLEVVVPFGILTSEEIGQAIIEKTRWRKHMHFLTKIMVKVQGRIFCTDLWDVSLATRICKLKLLITDDYRRIFQGHEFTLGHKGKELGDDVMLASIYIPGEELILEVHSVNFVVKLLLWNQKPWEFPITIKTADLEERGEIIIKSQIYSCKNIHPENLSIIHFAKYFPGSAVKVAVSTHFWIMILLYSILFFWGVVDFFKSSYKYCYCPSDCYWIHGALNSCLGLYLMLKWIIVDCNAIWGGWNGFVNWFGEL